MFVEKSWLPGVLEVEVPLKVVFGCSTPGPLGVSKSYRMGIPLPSWTCVPMFNYLCCEFCFLYQVRISLFAACLWPLALSLCTSKSLAESLYPPSHWVAVASNRVPAFSLLQAEQIQVSQLSLYHASSSLISGCSFTV